MHDIVTGEKTVEEARNYYAREFKDYRRKKPTPNMEKLRFTPLKKNTADPDSCIISDKELQEAKAEGTKSGS